jgi:hypothetical protein
MVRKETVETGSEKKDRGGRENLVPASFEMETDYLHLTRCSNK